MMMMMMGGAFANNPNFARNMQPSSHNNYLTPSPPTQSSPLPSKRQATDAAIDYPTLDEWLEALEEHPTRNKHAEQYTQYARTLVDTHKLFTIEDLVPLTGSELANVGNMEFGTASRILRFAREDATAIDRNKKHRTH
jgi:hypothetical protein